MKYKVEFLAMYSEKLKCSKLLCIRNSMLQNVLVVNILQTAVKHSCCCQLYPLQYSEVIVCMCCTGWFIHLWDKSSQWPFSGLYWVGWPGLETALRMKAQKRRFYLLTCEHYISNAPNTAVVNPRARARHVTWKPLEKQKGRHTPNAINLLTAYFAMMFSGRRISDW